LKRVDNRQIKIQNRGRTGNEGTVKEPKDTPPEVCVWKKETREERKFGEEKAGEVPHIWDSGKKIVALEEL